VLSGDLSNAALAVDLEQDVDGGAAEHEFGVKRVGIGRRVRPQRNGRRRGQAAVPYLRIVSGLLEQDEWISRRSEVRRHAGLALDEFEVTARKRASNERQRVVAGFMLGGRSRERASDERQLSDPVIARHEEVAGLAVRSEKPRERQQAKARK
jgi:hypothetical protein